MAIYKGDKKINLYKGNYNLVDFYKGDRKILGYDLTTVSGSNPLKLSDVSETKHAIKCKLRGKNFFNKENMDHGNEGYVYMACLLEDGRIFVPCNGTYPSFSPNRTLRQLAPHLEIGKTYILTADTTSTNKYIYFDEAAVGWFFGTTITMTDTILDSRFYFYSSKTEAAYITNFQIEEGTVATSYAPYGKVYVKHKNLFNVNNMLTVDESSVTYSGLLHDGRIFVPPVTTASNFSCRTYLRELAPELEVGKTYVLSAESTTTPTRIRLQESSVVWMFGTSMVVTQEMLDSRVQFYNNANNTAEPAYVTNVQIEEGIVATEYEPYVEPYIDVGGIEVKAAGKNLLDCGTVEVNEYKILFDDAEHPFPVQQYTFSTIATSTDTDDNTCTILWWYADKTYDSTRINRNTRSSASFTPKQPIVKFQVYASSGYDKAIGDTAIFRDCQLEVGSAATAYEPYVEQISSISDENGDVKGLLSISPSTILSVDSKYELNMRAEYLKN